MNSTFGESRLQRITSQFLPNAQWQGVESIPTGHINHTFCVTVSLNGEIRRYLLQNLNINVFTRPHVVTRNIVRCSEFLHRECPDYPYEILTPVALQPSGDYLLERGSEAWRMFEFIEKAKSLNEVTSSHEASMIGEAFGVFLRYINRDDPDRYEVTIPDFHNFTKRYVSFKEYLENREAVQEEKARYLIAEIERFAPEYLKLEKIDFPVRIIHHDTKANNVMLHADTGLPKCIIDLDTLMPGHIFSDFGDLIRTVLNPYGEDNFPENANLVGDDLILSLFDGFLSPLSQLLTNAEKEYLIKGGKKITLLQVLRFLEDHLKGDKYYQIKYAGHNLQRALSQMYLFQSMENNLLFNTPLK